MNATILRPEEALPLDFSNWVEKTTLMRLAFDAIDATDWPRPRVVAWDRTPEPVLRTLLSFCYMTGVFSSSEISSLSETDPSVRYVCANDFPTWEEVRQFRRQNLHCLRETLARMLLSLSHDLNISFLQCLTEADRRLSLAVQADSAAMDN
jgi:hypothetical protein